MLSSVCRHLPWAWLKTLMGLAQDTKLAESSRRLEAQVAQKNVQRVEGRFSKSSSLSSGVVPSTAAVAAAKKRISYHNHNHQWISGEAARIIGSISSHRGIREENFSAIWWPETNLVTFGYHISRFAQRGASIDRNATKK